MRPLITSLLSRFRESSQVFQPTPSVSAADVDRIIRRDFSLEQFDLVNAILDEYRAGKSEHDCTRVYLAVLKLSGGNLDSLRSYIRAAKRDYRDVLAPAEYPSYTRVGMFQVKRLRRKEQQHIVDRDLAQYQQWLNR